ncbi:unnamed protein product, partial [Oikopleura dioica]
VLEELQNEFFNDLRRIIVKIY